MMCVRTDLLMVNVYVVCSTTTMASTDTARENTVRPPSGAMRPPPLEKLAAFMGAQSKEPNSNSTSRPRLAVAALRTGSSTSVTTSASTLDSTAVNLPNTRSASPSALSTSPPHSETRSMDGEAGDALTSERLEKLDQDNPSLQEKKPVKVGYKNIPSLDTITARLVKARQLSIDGTAKPPEAPMIEDPKTPGVQMKAPEHPLQFPWCVSSENTFMVFPSKTSGEFLTYLPPQDNLS